MPIVSFSPVERKQTHVIVTLYAESARGKTYSAILLAKGLAGPNGKVGLLDTENGRGAMYSKNPGGYLYGELTPPFTSERYIEAIRDAEKAGVTVLIIDSASHQWEGLGGVLDQADEGGGKGLQKWLKPKVRHKQFMRAVLSTPLHLIMCLRAKEKLVQKGNDIVSAGYVPIQDKRFTFDTTIQLFFPSDGEPGAPIVQKVPEELAALLPLGPLGRRITAADGLGIAQWVAEGEPVDTALQALINAAREEADKGTPAFRAWWRARSAADKGRLKAETANLSSIASAADDRLAAETEPEDEEAGDRGPAAHPFGKPADAGLDKIELDIRADIGEMGTEEELDNILAFHTDHLAQIAAADKGRSDALLASITERRRALTSELV